jgi:deoxyribodipyrimidine photolyase-related protein
MKTLRLLLGDQLNPVHPWFTQTSPNHVYVLMEVRQETDYVLHHAQKILGIFAAMRDFARHLSEAGHTVVYLQINDPKNLQSIPENLRRLFEELQIDRFEYLEPDEWRLDSQLRAFAESLPIPAQCTDSAHFLTARTDAATFFGSRRQWRMELFYRWMRTRYQVLLEKDEAPVGGQWNFDPENRKPWKGEPAVPADWRTPHDHSALWSVIELAGVRSFGNPMASEFRWPLNRTEALRDLECFVTKSLPAFGDFQDALSSKSWRLFHSLLSFALNTKMISPLEVIRRTEHAFQTGNAPLAAAEGFIRQILGWREYVRGVYWQFMPDYAEQNFFEHRNPLPAWFWTGKTKMRCVSQAISQSLEHAYAHHIQRLMVIGNFALLAGLDPAQVHRWYLGIYIDAFEWVELPNTVGMSQFADGGQLASKPYVSSAAYLDRMSDACGSCAYKKKERIGPHACPFNSLYWDFFARHAPKLRKNVRLAMVYRQLEKMTPAQVESLSARAAQIRSQLDIC